MYLKRLYDKSSGIPVVSGVRVLRSGSRQHFSPRLLKTATAEGWLSFDENRVVITSPDGNLIYTVLRQPGVYCCHCESKFENGTDAKLHKESEHINTPSPDINNPDGYRHDNYYDCVKEE